MENGCDIYWNNHAQISPIAFSLFNQCHLSFIRFLGDNYSSNRFNKTILSFTNEYLWPMIITNIFKQIPIDSNNEQTFGSYIISLASEKNFHKLLKTLSLKTNVNGDIAIEYFIKISSKFFNYY